MRQPRVPAPFLAALMLAVPLMGRAVWADGMPQDRPGERADGVELPVVPASVDPRRAGRARPPQPAAAAATSAPPPERQGTTVVAAPGETKALLVSAGNVNRIVTPFVDPDVVTASGESIQVRRNVLYVAPATAEPVALYVTEKGDETAAISLLLVPRAEIAPREVRLALPGQAARPRLTPSTKTAQSWERDQPYEATLTDLVARLAAGVVPPGYDLATPPVDPRAAPRCARLEPFRVDFTHGQHLPGGQLEAWTGILVNAGAREAEFAEAACATTAEVAAVAVWPSPRLRPGEQAEIYVVRRIPSPEAEEVLRPSLIGRRHDG